MTERGGRFYTAILPTELKIIFFLAVALNLVGNFRRYILNFSPKFVEIPPEFSISVGNSVDIEVLEHTHIGIAKSVGESVGKRTDRPGTLTVARIGICNVHR
jgi:hypothetical protein